MEYNDEDENPAWDSDGTILKRHFERAKQIWEALLPGEGEFSLDFEWDEDIPGLGLTSLFDTIEIKPNGGWFADPTREDDVEFGMSQPKLFSHLTPAEQSDFVSRDGASGLFGSGIQSRCKRRI
jgi:hypothetical protein